MTRDPRLGQLDIVGQRATSQAARLRLDRERSRAHRAASSEPRLGRAAAACELPGEARAERSATSRLVARISEPMATCAVVIQACATLSADDRVAGGETVIRTTSVGQPYLRHPGAGAQRRLAARSGPTARPSGAISDVSPRCARNTATASSTMCTSKAAATAR